MDNKDVPYMVHEGDMARMERNSRRLWIIVLVLIVLLVGSNIAWLCYENSMEEVSTTVEQEVEQDNDSGDNNFVGGDYINGTTEGEDKNNN